MRSTYFSKCAWYLTGMVVSWKRFGLFVLSFEVPNRILLLYLYSSMFTGVISVSIVCSFSSFPKLTIFSSFSYWISTLLLSVCDNLRHIPIFSSSFRRSCWVHTIHFCSERPTHIIYPSSCPYSCPSIHSLCSFEY